MNQATNPAAKIEDELTAWISREVLEGADVGLTSTTPLLELGLIDSTTLVKLQRFVASQFGVKVPNKVLTPNNLGSIRAIAGLIAEIQGGAA